jgi:hypothetical protein
MFGLVLGALGYPMGVQKAFDLKLRAQTTMTASAGAYSTRNGTDKPS